MCHLSDDGQTILREKHLVLGLTQQQAANRAGVVLQQYQKFESGARNIMTCSFKIACRVIEALEMDITDFYHGKNAIGEEVYFSEEGLRYKKPENLPPKILSKKIRPRGNSPRAVRLIMLLSSR